MASGLILPPNLRFFVGCSSTSPAKDNCGLLDSWIKTLATWRANFWGYSSVHWDNFTQRPSTCVFPAIGRWWCSPEHSFPWRARCRSTDVEHTVMRFRIGSWVWGSRRSPILHMSNSFQSVFSRISDIPGVFQSAEPSAAPCQSEPCFLLETWTTLFRVQLARFVPGVLSGWLHMRWLIYSCSCYSIDTMDHTQDCTIDDGVDE